MRRLIVLFLCLSSSAWAVDDGSPLAGHPSPFFSMHADDLVRWRAWDDSVLEEARAEGKLILVVSGFYSCAWCHAVQDESYRNRQIADFINEHFVPVVVDRILAPGIDTYLRQFVRRTRGTAGWPLHVFLTPDGHPLAGTVYLKPEELYAFLQRIQERWSERSDELSDLAAHAAKPSRASRRQRPLGGERIEALGRDFRSVALARADELEGGFGAAAKFPRIPQLQALLELPKGDAEDPVVEFLQLTLDRMAEGALRDHLAGGFFRYTADPSWEHPQFEKMLYVNAQLARLYLRAAGALDRPEYRQVGIETLDFLLARMKHPEGGFIAAFAAVDQGGQEGGHYLWPPQALKQVLDPEELKLASAMWGLDEPVLLDAGRLPIPRRRLDDLSEQFGKSPAELAAELETSRRKLMVAREERLLPSNDMRIAGWNGLVLSALAEGASSDPRFQEEGEALYGTIRDFFWDGTALARVRALDGAVLTGATLADHAYVAQGLLDWSEAANDAEAAELANRIADAAWDRYWSEGWAPAEPHLPGQTVRPLLADGAMPSPAAVLAAVTLRLTEGQPDSPVRKKAMDALSADPAGLSRSLFDHASYLPVLDSTHP